MNHVRNTAGMFFQDLLFPNRCDCCLERIGYRFLICDTCAQELDTLRITGGDWSCGKAGEAMPWSDLYTLFAYRGIARMGVLAMKDGKRGFGRYAAALLAAQIRETLPQKQISCITWVPIAADRRRIQGYAHAELLGKAIAGALQIPARGDLLTETSSRIRQHHLPAKERILFAQRFRHTDADLRGQTVLLCDDVLTTGNTLQHCTKLLLEMGAADVRVATVCCRIRNRTREDTAE